MTEVVIRHPDAAEDPNHVAAMIAKVDAANTPPLTAATPATTEANTSERPAWLPEGFNTPEELAAAYTAATTSKAPATETPEAANAATEAATAAVAKANLDMTALETKVATNGQLDDSDYTALHAAGITRSMVDSYIQGQQALGEALNQRVHAHVGGKEAFDSVMSWAAGGGLTQAEAKAFNDIVDTGSEASVLMALDGLKAKYAAAGQQAPQLMNDMADPRYHNDPAFRQQVEARLSRSNVL
jgi:hypothetical protein